MKLRTRIAVAVVMTAIFGLIGAIAEPHVSAATVAITVTGPDTVAAGQPITFAAVANDGSVPSNPRITWFNPRTGRTLNVANSSVISVAGNLFTYRPDVSEIGRLETFSVVTSCTRLGCLVTGSKTFTVTG